MRLLVLAVGGMKAGPERELLARYLDRAAAMARGVGIAALQSIEIGEGRGPSASERRRAEASALCERLPAGATAILLDEGGRDLGSQALADLIARERDAATAALAFVIGGPDGLDPAWRSGQLTLAFGAATFPHQLVRIMLAEQIYRAFTILAGHPYHRG